MKFEDVKKTKYGLAYFVASCAMILLSIVVIIVLLIKHATWLMFVYLGLSLAYAVCILVLEILKPKEKKEVAKAPEAAKEPEIHEEPEEPEEPEEDEKAEKKERADFVPFTERLRRSDPFVVYAYDEIKSELLSYGFKSRISQKGDSFRLHRKLYAKITIAGKTLKMYMALNPKDYENTTIPFKDASDVKKYEEVPFVFKAKSDLSIRRAKRLIEDMAGNDNIEQKKVKKERHTKEALKNAK